MAQYESYNIDLTSQQYQAPQQSAYPVQLPSISHQIPQLGAPAPVAQQQHQQQHQQYAAPSVPPPSSAYVAAAATPSYPMQQPSQVMHPQFPQQQAMPMGMPMSMGMPLPIYSFPAPSFETPQGTYYFVPNSNAGKMNGQLSWDDEDKKMGKKGKKGGKNQTKRFICPHPDCGRGFARNFNMQSHLKSHLGIREFDCEHCPKKFSRRHDRARHCAAVHDVVHTETNSPDSPEVDDHNEEDDESG